MGNAEGTHRRCARTVLPPAPSAPSHAGPSRCPRPRQQRQRRGCAGRTPQRGAAQLARPARRRLLPSPRTVAGPAAAAQGARCPPPPARPPGAAPAQGARGSAARRGEARRSGRRKKRERSRRRPRPPGAPAYPRPALCPRQPPPARMREPVSSTALPAAGAERRGAASASIHPAACASGPCGHSHKGRDPFRGRGCGKGRYPLHPLLGPASARPRPGVRCGAAEASRDSPPPSGQGGTPAGAAPAGAGSAGHRGCAGGGGQRARPADPADSAESRKGLVAVWWESGMVPCARGKSNRLQCSGFKLFLYICERWSSEQKVKESKPVEIVVAEHL